MHRGVSRDPQGRCHRGPAIEGEKGHEDGISPSPWERGQGMEEKEKKPRHCSKDVSLALGMKTKAPI